MPLRPARGQLRGVRINDRRDCPARHRLHRGAQPRCIVSAGGLGAAPVTAPGRASPAGSVLVCGRLPKALRRPGSPGLASPAAALRSSARPVHVRAGGRAAPSHTGASLSPRQSPCPGPLWGEPVVAGTGSLRGTLRAGTVGGVTRRCTCRVESSVAGHLARQCRHRIGVSASSPAMRGFGMPAASSASTSSSRTVSCSTGPGTAAAPEGPRCEAASAARGPNAAAAGRL